MQIKFFGIGNAPLLSVKVNTLDDLDGLLNVSSLARLLQVHRSTFLSKIGSIGLEPALRYFLQQQQLKEVR